MPAFLSGMSIALISLLLVGLALLSAAIPAWIILLGARVAGIEGRSFGRAFVAYLAGGVTTLFMMRVFSGQNPFSSTIIITSVGEVIGAGCGLIISVFASAALVIGIFNTTYRKALIAWAFAVIPLVMVIALWMIIALNI